MLGDKPSREARMRGGNPNPGGGKGDGVVLLYENVRIAITGGKVQVDVQTQNGEGTTVIDQKDGTSSPTLFS